MNSRRDFFKMAGAALATFTVLPAATTYTRLWKAVAVGPRMREYAIVNPAYVHARFEVRYVWSPLSTPSDPDIVPIRFPMRFTQAPPLEVMQSEKSFRQWSQQHSVPPFKRILIHESSL